MFQIKFKSVKESFTSLDETLSVYKFVSSIKNKSTLISIDLIKIMNILQVF